MSKARVIRAGGSSASPKAKCPAVGRGSTPPPATKCQHRKEPELGYIQWHSDAERRHKKGERQLYCPYCLKWIWQSFYNTSSDSSKGAK